jgi:uncharacterized protein YecT (DUF1311 family)
MKCLLLFSVIFFFSIYSSAQVGGTKEITPAVLQKLKVDIEKQIPALQKKLKRQNITEDQIEFYIDTFRITQLLSKRMALDYSYEGMSNSVKEMTESYDTLLNKYYNMLYNILNPDDQKVLLKAQRAWLSFREAERNLIDVTIKDEYTGGGAIWSNIRYGSYADLVINRTNDLFNYYNQIMINR